MTSITIKTLLLFLVIAFGEVINGVLRTTLLNPRFGDFRARQISLISGVAIIYTIGWYLIPFVKPSNSAECLHVGSILMVGMILFDVLFGRLVFKFSWERIAQDFNVFKGNLLFLGMVALFFMPIIVFFIGQ